MSDQTQPPFNAEQDKQWAMWAHLGGIVVILGFLISWGWILAIVPALVIFLVNGRRGSRTREEAREALNFQITMVGALVIWAIATMILGTIFAVFTNGGLLWGLLSTIFTLVTFALILIDLVFSIIAGVRVTNGGSYRYPFALRLVK